MSEGDGGASDLDKLRIVSEAYKKLQAQSAVLKKAVVAEQARSGELSVRVASLEAALSERTADVRSKEIDLRRVLEAKDALEFNNQSLAKRLASLAAAPPADAAAAAAAASSSSEQDDLVLALQKELALKLAELAQLQARVPTLEASELRLTAVQRELADATAKAASIDALRADLAKQTARADALASRLLALSRERDDVDAQRKAALEQARVAAALAADLVRQRDAVGASLADLLAPPLPETLQPVLTLTADEWDGNGSAFARTLGARNCAVPSFDRAALIQSAVGQLVALVGGSSGSGAANAAQSTPSLVQRVSESIAAAERAYDVRNRGVDAGVELITANGNAMTALRAARDSLLALCDVGAMFAKHAREPAALDRLLAALDDYAAAASAAAVAQSKSAVAASSTPGCAAAVASALVGVAAAFSALSTAATDAAAMPRRWKAILFGDDAGDAAANEPVCHAAVALGACRGLRLLLDAQRRATAAQRALAQTERQSGAALPDALAFNDAVVACAAAVDDSLEDVARHFRRIAALLAAPRSATLVRGVLVAAGATAAERALIAAQQQSRVAEAAEFAGRSAPRHRHRGVTMIERDLTTLIASTTAAISSGGGGGGATSAAAGGGNDGNTAPRYEQRYSIAVIDELGNTNEQLRLSAVDRDREKQMKLFYEQKAAALLAQITAADNRALELQMQNFQFKQELDEVRRKLLVRQ